MDDLLSHPSYYGLTITWSLFRGFIDLGDAMTDTWLLFLNADFILADGAYRSLLPRLTAGAGVILAPSYCTLEEEVLPLLGARLDPTSPTLAIPPRELADLMLDRLHYTVRAKTINRKMYRIEHVDQLYYAVDNDTIVARQLPIAIVAMKPQRVLTEPVALWDYGTISEACPTGSLSVIADSDEFLMLELRGRQVAREQLELGWLDPSAIARDLSAWTTRDQRRCGEHTLVLHRSALPATLEEGTRALGEFYERVRRALRPEPLSHRDHPIWVRLQTLHHEWRAAGGADATAESPHPWATAAAGHRPIGERLALGIRATYRAIFGPMHDVSPLHPCWVDLHPTRQRLPREGDGPGRIMAVWSTPGAVLAPRLKEWLGGLSEHRPDEIAGETAHSVTPAVDFCFVELTRDEVLRFRELYTHLRPRMRRGGRVLVLYRTGGVERLAARDIGFIVGALPTSDAVTVWYRGNPVIAALQRRWDESLGDLRKRRVVGAVRFGVFALLGAPITYLANRAAVRRLDRGELPRGCTSVCMEITVL
jgi:hypothetical protein